MSTVTGVKNACSSLEPGDIQILILNSDDPDEIAFFTLAFIPASVGTLFVTDDAWNGTGFVGNEGIINFTVPASTVDASGAICAGLCPGIYLPYPYGYDGKKWGLHDESVPFDLNVQGDNVFTYCLDPNGDPYFLNGFTNAADGWAASGLAQYSPQQSALPAGLETVGSVAVTANWQNVFYNGTTTEVSLDELKALFASPSSYAGSNTERKFVVQTSGASSWSLLATFLCVVVQTLLQVLG